MNEKKIEELEKLIKKQGSMINILMKRMALMERENKRRTNEIASIPRK